MSVSAHDGALRRPKVVLFDAGNTLVFLDHDALAEAAPPGRAIDGALLRRVEPLAKKSYEAALSAGMSHEKGWDLYIRTQFECAGLSVADATEATRRARALHDDFNLWRKVPPGLRDALESGLASGLRYGIVSNSEGQLAQLLERVGLAGFFEHVLDSAIEGVRKPDPEIFRRALARMDVSAEDALYAGDIPHVDVDGARAVGMQAVLIDTLDHYPEYTAAMRLPSVGALLSLLCG